MKVSIRDLETLRTVRPLEVVSYLRAHRWQQAEKIERGAFWIKEEGGTNFEILLPLDAKLRDFPNRIAEVLATLEHAEQRSPLEIVEDLATTSADVVHSRLPGSNLVGEISLEQGRIVYEQARNLMLAAACAAVEKRPLFAKRKSEQAMNFLHHARFGMPQRGSYILTIISPVSPKISPGKDLLGYEIAEEPFERRTMRTLAEAVYALEIASAEVAATGELEPMKAAVRRGVSANLCEAIIGLHEGSGEKGVEFAFSWAPLRDVPESVPRSASLTPDFISIIRETARLFRETETTGGIEVLGVVNRLAHQGGDHGLVKIAGTADGIPRNVTTGLAGPDHSLAVRSYEERIPLSCVGELTRDGRSWALRNPREIELLSGDAAPPLNEAMVEEAALTWFRELGYAIGHGPQRAPGEPAGEREPFGEVLLVGRLREAIRRLNPSIPEDAREEALRKVRRVGNSSLVLRTSGERSYEPQKTPVFRLLPEEMNWCAIQGSNL